LAWRHTNLRRQNQEDISFCSARPTPKNIAGYGSNLLLKIYYLIGQNVGFMLAFIYVKMLLLLEQCNEPLDKLKPLFSKKKRRDLDKDQQLRQPQTLGLHRPL
jgi:hypothetical protein